MACVSPLVRFDAFFHYSDNKIVPYLPKRREYRSGFFYNYKEFFKVHKDLYNNKYLNDYLLNENISLIPCSHCFACQLNRSKIWAQRILLESQYFNYNYFITLTYNDLHIKFCDLIVKKTGEVLKVNTLSKRDIQLFMKRLRKSLGNNIKFFVAGEYGSSTNRPHYHLILMSNVEIPDLIYETQYSGNVFYSSKLISSKWSDKLGEIGNIAISDMTENTVFYTAHYCLKKAYSFKNDNLYDIDSDSKYDFQKEFQLMSRRPGLSTQFFYDKVVPSYNDLTTFKFKEQLINIKSIKFFNYLFDKNNIEIDKCKSLSPDILLYNNDYLTKYDLLQFKEKCKFFDNILHRSKI